MRSVKVIVFGAAIFSLASLVIHIILAHTPMSENYLQSAQELLNTSNKYVTNDLRKYIECELTGADVIECIRTYGESYSIDVLFPSATEGVYVTHTISDVSEYLDPMNQVNTNGNFVSKISSADDEAWIDSNVKYTATFKKSGSTIVGLEFKPVGGQQAKYDYSGVTQFAYFNELQRLSTSYKKLNDLQDALDNKLKYVVSTDEELSYGNSPLRKRIEQLYYNYARIYFYYGYALDDGWEEKSQAQRRLLLNENTNKQVMKFCRPEWNGEELRDLWDTKLPDLNSIARPVEGNTETYSAGYSYEITTTFGNSVTTVIQKSIIEDALGNVGNLSSVRNNNRGWTPKAYLMNNEGRLKLDNGTAYDFVVYDEDLHTIQTHFSQGYPNQIKTHIQNALINLQNAEKYWNRWSNYDKQSLIGAREHLLDARSCISEYYDSYIGCRQACESLKNKYELPACVQDVYERCSGTISYRGLFDDEVSYLWKDSLEIIKIDTGVKNIIGSQNINETNFFGSNDNAYLNTALVLMNQSVDVSALRGTSSADNDYKDLIDNAIKEINTLLAREVD